MKRVLLYLTAAVIVVFGGFYLGYIKYLPERTINKPLYDNALIGEAAEISPKESGSGQQNPKRYKITPSTKIVYEYYYEGDGRVETVYEEPPYFLIDETEDDLKKALTDWEILSFNETEVVMRKNIEGKSDQHYIIGEHEGYVAVFYEKEINGGSLKELTDTPISSLPEEEQSKIKAGINVSGENELHKILEDYGS